MGLSFNKSLAFDVRRINRMTFTITCSLGCEFVWNLGITIFCFVHYQAEVGVNYIVKTATRTETCEAKMPKMWSIEFDLHPVVVLPQVTWNIMWYCFIKQWLGWQILSWDVHSTAGPPATQHFSVLQADEQHPRNL